MKKLTIAEMLEMSDEELHEVSMRKKRDGCATKEALTAQRIIWERSGRCFKPISGMELGNGNRTSKKY